MMAMNNQMILQAIAGCPVGDNLFRVIDSRVGHTQLVEDSLFHKFRIGLTRYFGYDHPENKRSASITPSLPGLKFQWCSFQRCKKSAIAFICIKEIIILI